MRHGRWIIVFAIIHYSRTSVSGYCLLSVNSDKINLVWLRPGQWGLDPSLTCSHVPMPREFIAYRPGMM